MISRRDGVEAALPWYRESDAISARLVALSPANVGFQDDLAQSAMDLAIALSDLKRHEECRAELQRALDLLQRQGVDENQPSRALHLRAEALHMMGNLEIEVHRTAVGQVAYQGAIELMTRELGALDTVRVRLDLACALLDLADTRLDPRAELDRVQALLEPLRGAESDNPEFIARMDRMDKLRRKAGVTTP